MLIEDAWAFVVSGQIPVGTYLDLVKAYVGETEHAVWGRGQAIRLSHPGGWTTEAVFAELPAHLGLD